MHLQFAAGEYGTRTRDERHVVKLEWRRTHDDILEHLADVVRLRELSCVDRRKDCALGEKNHELIFVFVTEVCVEGYEVPECAPDTFVFEEIVEDDVRISDVRWQTLYHLAPHVARGVLRVLVGTCSHDCQNERLHEFDASFL